MTDTRHGIGVAGLVMASLLAVATVASAVETMTITG